MNSTNKSQNLSNYQVLALNAKYSLINSISVSAVYFICSVLLARYLGAKELGIIVITNYLLVFINCVFGNDLSGVKLISQHKSQEHNVYVILKGMLCYTILFSLACTLGLLTLYWIPSKFIANNIRPYLLSITIIVIMNLFLGLWSSFWDGFQRMDWAMTTSIIPQTIKALSFVLLILGGFGLKSFLWAWAGIWGIYPVIILPLIFWIFIKKKKLIQNTTKTSFPHQDYLIYGFFLKIPGLLKSLAPLAISLYLGHIMMDTYEIGIFGVACTLASLVTVLTLPIGRALFPNLSRSHSEGDNAYLIDASTKAYRYLGLFVVVLITALILLREHIISLLYGKEFYKAVEIIIFLGIAFFFDSMKTISSVILNATDNASSVTKIEILGTILLFITGSILISSFGIKGAAITITIASVFTSVLTFLTAEKLTKIRNRPFLYKSLLALFAFGIVPYLRVNAFFGYISILITILFFIRGITLSEIYNLTNLILGRVPKQNEQCCFFKKKFF